MNCPRRTIHVTIENIGHYSGYRTHMQASMLKNVHGPKNLPKPWSRKFTMSTTYPSIGKIYNELHAMTSRQLAKQISNHCSQKQIVDSVTQIVRAWSHTGPSPFPIFLGPIDNKMSLFNPNTADAENVNNIPKYRKNLQRDITHSCAEEPEELDANKI